MLNYSTHTNFLIFVSLADNGLAVKRRDTSIFTRQLSRPEENYISVVL